MGTNRKLTAAEDALLGKLSDKEIARGLGIGKLSVFKRRKKLGISATKVRAAVRPTLRGGMKNALPKRLGERPIGELTADEYLAAAQQISELRRSGRGE
jgi:hypothetical protein